MTLEIKEITQLEKILQIGNKTGWENRSNYWRERLNNGHINSYNIQFKEIQNLRAQETVITNDGIQIILTDALKMTEYHKRVAQLKSFKYWRKGPISIDSIDINSEWDSRKKWNRIASTLEPFIQNKIILDIGCNNGYYMFLASQYNPKFCLGIDPMLLYYYQYKIIQHLIQDPKIGFLLGRIEEIKDFTDYFDTILCWGILYHRKNPAQYLKDVYPLLKQGGVLCLETLTIPGQNDLVIPLQRRYANMRNISHIPSIHTLQDWLKNAGFKHSSVIHEGYTRNDEQRSTEWTTEVSLKDALNPLNNKETIEGYSAPHRSMLYAFK